jgi:3-oxoacyl-[acyl-carrier protein] reductase
MSASNHLSGKSAIVTGGSRGIGNAVGLALAAEGVNVLLCGRHLDQLSASVGRQTVTGAPGPAGTIEVCAADVRDPDQVEALVARVVERFGGLDIVVNNAGVGRFCQLAEMSVEDWREVIGTNLDGVFFTCRSAIPELRKRGGGWVINVSSLAGSHPFAGGAAYCASKAGLDALTEVLMQEVRHDDIRVSCVAPGSVDTRFAGQAGDGGAPWKLDPYDVARVVIDLLRHESRSLPSRVEIRPSRPRK